jgi:hypothetical protein
MTAILSALLHPLQNLKFKHIQFGTDFMSWTGKTIFEEQDIDDRIQIGLVRVYSLLLSTTLASVIGAEFYKFTYFPPLFLSLMLMLVLVSNISMEYPSSVDQHRVGKLIAFGFFQGCALESVFQFFLSRDSKTVPVAFIRASLTFACLSASTTMNNRRSWLYIGGAISAFVSWMIFTSMFTYFFSSIFLLAGLVVFFAYVCFETQILIEKLQREDSDYVKHALDMFIDMLNIGMRLLIVALWTPPQQQQQQQQQQQEQKQTQQQQQEQPVMENVKVENQQEEEQQQQQQPQQQQQEEEVVEEEEMQQQPKQQEEQQQPQQPVAKESDNKTEVVENKQQQQPTQQQQPQQQPQQKPQQQQGATITEVKQSQGELPRQELQESKTPAVQVTLQDTSATSNKGDGNKTMSSPLPSNTGSSNTNIPVNKMIPTQPDPKAAAAAPITSPTLVLSPSDTISSTQTQVSTSTIESTDKKNV